MTCIDCNCILEECELFFEYCAKCIPNEVVDYKTEEYLNYLHDEDNKCKQRIEYHKQGLEPPEELNQEDIMEDYQ